MINQEHGVLLKSKLYRLCLSKAGLYNLLFKPALLLLLFLTHIATPTTALSVEKQLSHKNDNKHQIYILYSPENKLERRISESLSDTLNQSDLLEKSNTSLVIRRVPHDKKLNIDHKNDMIISIGRNSLESAKRRHPKTGNLFISTDTDTFQPASKKTKKEAVLYISQPFCRKLGFIRAINDTWSRISILTSKNKNLDTAALKKCARDHELKLYFVKTDDDKSLSRSIKDALEHSDILLATPDKSIYNRKSVKNILLTSYRYRKPVIAFSGSFVRAGALASIHSNTEQITKSASQLIRDYFTNKQKFTTTINYPQLFDISINRQVFSALGITVPDIDKLKQYIVYTDAKASGFSK